MSKDSVTHPCGTNRYLISIDLIVTEKDYDVAKPETSGDLLFTKSPMMFTSASKRCVLQRQNALLNLQKQDTLHYLTTLLQLQIKRI